MPILVVMHHLAAVWMGEYLQDQKKQTFEAASEQSPYVSHFLESASEVPHNSASPSVIQKVGVAQAAAVDARFWECAAAGREVWAVATVVAEEASSFACPVEEVMGGIVDVGEGAGGAGYAGTTAVSVDVAAGPLRNGLSNFLGEDSSTRIAGLALEGNQGDWESRPEYQYR